MKKISITLTLMILIWFSCTRDTFTPTGFDCEEEVSYDSNIRAIIDNNCAYSGCHLGPVGIGDYSSYDGMRPWFDGAIMDRVVSRASDPVLGMPPDNATGPPDLTEEEFKLINCWIAQDFPEN